MTEEILKIIKGQGWTDQEVLQLLWNYVEAQGQDDAVLDHFINAKMSEDSALDSEEQLPLFEPGEE
jgi:hypothetical protein